MTSAARQRRLWLRVPRRVQAALALLSLPLAVAATVVLVTAPAARTVRASASSPAPALAGVRVEIAAFGDPVEAYGLADRLGALGADVTRVVVDGGESAGREPPGVVYSSPAERAAAARVQDLLGRGTLRRTQVFTPGVDLRIVVD